jgi:rRNA-processing protein FCF1
MPLRVYVDTNILMEHQPLDQLPLDEIVGEKVDVAVIPFRVLGELTQHKYSHDKRKRRRAEAAEKLVARLRVSPVLPSGCEVVIVRIKEFDYAAHDLDPQSQDDRIIATLISQAVDYPGDRHVLLTADQPLSVLAEELGIECTTLVGYRLAAGEPDDHQPRAKPVLTFEDEARFMEALVPLPPNPAALERETLAKYWAPQVGAGANAAMMAVVTAAALAGSWPKSREDVVGHAAKLQRYACKTASAVPVHFCLSNEGSAVADDLDIFMEFDPAVCAPFTQAQLPKYPRNETAMTALARLSRPLSHDIDSPGISDGRDGDGRRVVHYHVDRIKHGMLRRLSTLYLVPADTEHPASFSVKYAINSASLEKPVASELHVKLASSDRLDLAALLRLSASEQ